MASGFHESLKIMHVSGTLKLEVQYYRDFKFVYFIMYSVKLDIP
jgi:hypothetical protein